MSESCCGPKETTPKNNSIAPEGSVETTFKVKGMDCADEIAAIERSLKHSSIFKIDANLMNELVTIYHDSSVSNNTLKTLVEKAGVKIVSEENVSFLGGHGPRIGLIATAGIILAVAMLAEWRELLSQNALITLNVISILLAGSLVFPKAFRSLKSFSLDMNVLMSIAVIGAFVIKEYSEAATVVFLFSLAELLEALSVARARKAIREVLKVTPKTALVLGTNGQQTSTDVTLIKVGETILVRPGESIPMDGVIVDGESSVNQAALTGESVPVEKKKNDKVLAGTLNELGVLKIKVESAFQNSKISKIISLIENAQNQKAPAQRFVDKFAKIYTPTILVFAILIAIVMPFVLNQSFDLWVYRALVLLVIGCPCALVIATPVSVVSGLTSLAKRGVLVKGGVYLEALGKIKALALDKTGTITIGHPVVKDLKNFSALSESEVIHLTASLESVSTHPLAKAVMTYASEKNVKTSDVTNYKLLTGRGAQGSVNGHEYFIGNHALAHELGACTPELEKYLEALESQSLSVIVLGHKAHNNCPPETLAVFSVGDLLRDGVKDAIAQLHHAGVEKVVMLSGDNQKTVEAVSKMVGIDEALGNLLPDDKVEQVKKLVASYKVVGMVGDGVNDAPALAHASVGIAMGVAGTDTAIETADIALMKDDLHELPKAIFHGKKVLNVIRFNIGFALAIKVVFLILALMGYSSLWLAVAADMGASLFVTFNALRLLKITEKF